MSIEKELHSASNFIYDIIEGDQEKGTYDGRVLTRFPPEPNGYLHIGHAKSICLNFSAAQKFGGLTTLRFDDTNPTTENVEFVNSIQRDIKWLGFDWEDRLYFASDYFPKLYELAKGLIQDGKAFVDSSSEEEIREFRGTVTEAGKNSRFRDRSVEENLDLFRRMKAGEFEDGSHVLRAKIDMSSNNMLMRDPLLYRIRKAHHYRTENEWCIYPMYDYAHPLSDAIEGITHSICTLEFEVHRPLYDWLIEHTSVEANPRQYEFARLNIDYTMTSKRKLKLLVEEGHVDGWDDPRMPTLAGLRRRGVRPDAIRDLCDKVGVAKADSKTDISLFDYCVRKDLEAIAPRAMAVLDPLKVTLSNWEEGKVDMMEAKNFPPDSDDKSTRTMPFTRDLFIERSDFEEDPPKGFKRLIEGGEVRLKHGYIIKCEEVLRDNQGEVSELICSYDPNTRSGTDTSGKKVKGTIHWVSATDSIEATLRIFDRLFENPSPADVEEGQTFLDNLNPNSLEIFENARLETSLRNAKLDDRYQFERVGYFIQDSELSSPEKPVFNLTISLRDTWKKAEKNSSKRAPKKEAQKEEQKAAEITPKEAENRDRFLKEFTIPESAALIIANAPELEEIFRSTHSHGVAANDLSKWVVNDVVRALKDGKKVDPENLAQLIGFVESDKISISIGRKVFDEMLGNGKSPSTIIDEQSLAQITDTSAIQAIIDDVLVQHNDKVDIYRSGKLGVLGFLVGQVMQKTGGKAKPRMVKELIADSIDGSV